MLREMVRTVALMGALLALGACGSEVGTDGVVVGGSCVVNNECHVDSRCLTGADFPDGYCAKSCASDADCPAGSRCADVLGGVCLQECASTDECRSDDGYECVERPSRGAAGTATVCATP